TGDEAAAPVRALPGSAPAGKLSIETRDKSRVFSSVRIFSRVIQSVDMGDPDQSGGGSWTLLTGHGHVLVEIARNPEARIRDIGAAVGLTRRGAPPRGRTTAETGQVPAPGQSVPVANRMRPGCGPGSVTGATPPPGPRSWTVPSRPERRARRRRPAW